LKLTRGKLVEILPPLKANKELMDEKDFIVVKMK
jgi:hypothetical protein